MNNSSCLFMPH